MRKKLLALSLVALALLLAGCGGPIASRPKYTIALWATPANGATMQSRGITGSDRVHVYAGDPIGYYRYVNIWAEVTDDQGVRVQNPAIAWTTTIPECVALTPMPDRTDEVKAAGFPGSQMGRGAVVAEYQGTVAEIPVFAYGLFQLEINPGQTVSEGWSFALQAEVEPEDADIYVVERSAGVLDLCAPYGIKFLGEVGYIQYGLAYFEDYPSPSSDGFTTEGEVNGIYEVIAQDGTHYKLAIATSGSASPPQRYWVEFAWDYYR